MLTRTPGGEVLCFAKGGKKIQNSQGGKKKIIYGKRKEWGE